MDALLVCKKDKIPNNYTDKNNYYSITGYISSFSENDIFVIKASTLLVQLNGQKLSYNETLEYLVTKSMPTSHLIRMS